MPETGHKKKKRSMLTPQGWWDSPIAGKVHFQSKYEKLFCEWLDKQGYEWRKNKERFPYISPFDGKQHMYIPDFVLVDTTPEHNPQIYIEVKGMVRKADPAKFEAFPDDKILVLLGYEELKELGLDVWDPMSEPKARELKPGQWPYKLLQNMPDFWERGELTEGLKRKVDPKPFYQYFMPGKWDRAKYFKNGKRI